jgi:acetyl-CoA acetyltransferase
MGETSHRTCTCTCCCTVCWLLLYRALEAVGLVPKGQGGAYIEQQYSRLLGPLEKQQQQQQQLASSSSSPVWPVNTHGGLLGYGAPWEVPAMISLVEAVTQLRGEAAGRQVQGARRALVYGNGGIFSASAVAILENAGSSLGSKL